MTLRRSLVTVCVWILLCVTLAASDARPAVVPLGGLVAVAAAVVVVISDLGKAVTPVRWARRRQEYVSTRGADPRIGSLRNQLYDARWFGSEELRETLVALVDDRLRAHHHIDMTSDPEAAMRVLSPALRQLVSNPRRPAAAVRQLEHIISDIESL